MSIATARAALASAASTVGGLNVRPGPTVRTPGPGDGWVVARKATPAGYTTAHVTFEVLVVLGGDSARAEELFELWGLPAMDAVMGAAPASNVALEAVNIALEQGGTLPGFTITLTTEV